MHGRHDLYLKLLVNGHKFLWKAAFVRTAVGCAFLIKSFLIF